MDKVMNTMKKVFKTPAVRYILIGGISLCIELAVISSLIAIGLGNVTAVAIAFWVGLILSFLLQKFVAFKNTDRNHRLIAQQLLIYCLLVGFNYLFTLVFVALLSNIANVLVVRSIAVVITTAWNFLLYKHVIFRK